MNKEISSNQKGIINGRNKQLKYLISPFSKTSEKKPLSILSSQIRKLKHIKWTLPEIYSKNIINN